MTDKFTFLAALLEGDPGLVTCDTCGAEATASVEPVSGRPRVVYVCAGCGQAWAKTV